MKPLKTFVIDVTYTPPKDGEYNNIYQAYVDGKLLAEDASRIILFKKVADFISEKTLLETFS